MREQIVKDFVHEYLSRYNKEMSYYKTEFALENCKLTSLYIDIEKERENILFNLREFLCLMRVTHKKIKVLRSIIQECGKYKVRDVEKILYEI